MSVRPRRQLRALMVGMPLLVAACNGFQSALTPAGPQASRIDTLWWISFWISATVFAGVILALVYGLLHRRAPREAPAAPTPEPGPERATARVVGGAVAVTVVVLIVWLGVSVTTGRAVTRLPPSPAGPHPLVVEIVGHQWWWEIHYPDSAPSREVVTANELHVPVGMPVLVQLSSADVIHSFWVPSLDGKRDLLPGHVTTTWFQADTPGVFRGQCAEFCGYQHANMSLLVIAEPRARFEAWIAEERRPAAPPTAASAAAGEAVFVSGPCALCHTVQGTSAQGHTGPDLTHLASRRTLAAATLANTRGNLGGWIVDPQRIKPGANMPPNVLSPSDLQALLDYLGTLK